MRIYIVVLNWNGWEVTLRCLESLFHGQSDVQQRIVVWDNGSTDGSVERIVEWAEGQAASSGAAPHKAFEDCVLPPVPKPIVHAVINEGAHEVPQTPLVIIRGTRNLGYAGGNNAAMRWSLTRGDCSHVWILNNDVIVARDCLARMIAISSSDPYDRPVGSEIRDYAPPHALQAYGGQTLGHGWLVAPRHANVDDRLDFLVGASLFLSRQRASALGYFNEDYFLNAEDLEYTYQYGRNFRRANPGIEPFLVAGRLWHEESATQGRAKERHAYYFTRNLLYAASRIGPAHGLTTFCFSILRLAYSALLGRREAARGIARGLYAFARGKKGVMPA